MCSRGLRSAASTLSVKSLRPRRNKKAPPVRASSAKSLKGLANHEIALARLVDKRGPY
jgi:hypothetical protein